ncbi:hypothetical protein TRFO_11702 [Tritrichomonas foetus]|uniref:Uncharacterized protein n=1 Tax=Tritrichomonas foetus TaxID=1144522 RepID=A0A1J4J8E7_9EUKA|nr:hypothetical protein TRFO_11702 [Tritrichomonas foetus]|eukprot:OHS93508.1 hypothetical protein TRFO_11702 [Tritrichomonas foetus]
MIFFVISFQLGQNFAFLNGFHLNGHLQTALLSMERTINYHNSPTFLYCPSFISSHEFSFLDLKFESSKYLFSHREPGHQFVIANKDHYMFAAQEKKDDKWEYSAKFLISQFTNISLYSNNKYEASFHIPENGLHAIFSSDSLTISKQMRIDQFNSLFIVKVGKPIEFRANFQKGTLVTGCCVNTAKNSRENSFFYSYERPKFSFSGFILFNPISIKNFTISQTVSAKEGPVRVVGSVLFSESNKIFSSSMKYKTEKLLLALNGKMNLFPQAVNDMGIGKDSFSFAAGTKYKFKDFVGKLLFFKDHWGIGSEFRYKNHTIKPTIFMKYDKSQIGCKLWFESKD